MDVSGITQIAQAAFSKIQRGSAISDLLIFVVSVSLALIVGVIKSDGIVAYVFLGSLVFILLSFIFGWFYLAIFKTDSLRTEKYNLEKHRLDMFGSLHGSLNQSSGQILLTGKDEMIKGQEE